MASPNHVILLSALSLIALCRAGPLGPLPNVTSSDLGLKEGSCALGDVVYMSGDEFPGSSPCERCRCAGGGVQCSKQRCEPRPGCKALHRPDHCCPIYQCECEQEGRVYGNGEKLVDPQDPCRVCYCQGGEVVCRRIACFVRDDCRPRLVPGRCCPEYDNCPLRGVTTVAGMAQSISTVPTMPEVETNPAPTAPRENIKQEITIKEITPVSEIPVITEVKIKEILPSPNIEVAEYSSSKSPLIVREATSERTATGDTEATSKTDGPSVVEVQSSSSSISYSSLPPEPPTKSSESFETKTTNDIPPSKISFSTQDSINSEIYPSILTSVPTMGIPAITQEFVSTASTSKAPIIEEEDTSLFEHNPAFPPIPDDLSVLSNHEDENVADPNMDGEHVSVVQEVVSSSHATPATEPVVTTEPSTTTLKEVYKTTSAPVTVKITEISEKGSTLNNLDSVKLYSTVSSETTTLKQNLMINLRSAIPTEILNLPSAVPEDINGDLDEIEEEKATAPNSIYTSTTTENIIRIEDPSTFKTVPPVMKSTPNSLIETTDAETTTYRVPETTAYVSTSTVPEEQTSSVRAKSNIATEITAQTEFSSLPIETSDQNPHELSETIAKEKVVTTTADSQVYETTSTKNYPSIESEIITVSRTSPSNIDNQSMENVETTEFVLTSFGSSESATDAVELIKISANPEKSSSIIESTERRKTNVLTDLINLVGDVASIGDHTESPEVPRQVTTSTSISDSEELMPVNAGYKSKNNNWNSNSITEVPVKSKNQQLSNKQKIVEIEGDDTESITDSPPPYDKIEPTTRRPIIDNVSDDLPENKTEKKDIEIITKSYVPTINKRPTKVVMKKNVEPLVSETTERSHVSVSTEEATNSTAGGTSESSSTAEPEASPRGADERIVTS